MPRKIQAVKWCVVPHTPQKTPGQSWTGITSPNDEEKSRLRWHMAQSNKVASKIQKLVVVLWVGGWSQLHNSCSDHALGIDLYSHSSCRENEKHTQLLNYRFSFGLFCPFLAIAEGTKLFVCISTGLFIVFRSLGNKYRPHPLSHPFFPTPRLFDSYCKDAHLKEFSSLMQFPKLISFPYLQA